MAYENTRGFWRMSKEYTPLKPGEGAIAQGVANIQTLIHRAMLLPTKYVGAPLAAVVETPLAVVEKIVNLFRGKPQAAAAAA